MIVLRASLDHKCDGITGIAGRKGFSVINIEKDLMNSEIGTLRRFLRAYPVGY